MRETPRGELLGKMFLLLETEEAEGNLFPFFFFNVFVLCIEGSEDFWVCCSHFFNHWESCHPQGLDQNGCVPASPPRTSSSSKITGGSSGVCSGHEVTALLDGINVTEIFTMSTM